MYPLKSRRGTKTPYFKCSISLFKSFFRRNYETFLFKSASRKKVQL